jgi:hypothetical protein
MKQEVQSSTNSPKPSATATDGPLVATVEDLRRQFLAFRRANKRAARIPDSLRAAVLAALEQGVGQGCLQRACRFTSTQLASWRAEQLRRVPEMPSSMPGARVFSVVDEEVVPESARPTVGRDQPLEFRMGQWSVSIRLASE